jgi:hypothetical protein
MFRLGWRVNRKTGRERPFRPRLGGCLLWVLILIVVVVGTGVYLGRLSVLGAGGVLQAEQAD